MRRPTLEAPQPHFTGWSPGQRKCRCRAHLHGLQEPGIMGCCESVASPRPHLLVQQLHGGHGPGQGGAVGQRGAVRGAVGDGDGGALQRAAGGAELTQRHHRGGDEAGGEVGCVGEEQGALLGRASGCGGRGLSGVRQRARRRADGRAGVLRRGSLRRASGGSSPEGKRTEEVGGTLGGTGVTLGGGEHTLLLLGATGVAVE